MISEEKQTQMICTDQIYGKWERCIVFIFCMI